MKVFIAHKTPRGFGDYEASRVRKTLKGACELSGVTWVDDMRAFPEIVHFISPVDDVLIGEAKTNECKIVVSVGYSEFDPLASFFEAKDGDIELKLKSLRVIEKADLVLAPNRKIAEKIAEYGIVKTVKVVPPAVNLSRFQIEDGSEREIFLRYFSLLPEEKIVISSFDYSDKKALSALIEMASKLPGIRFFNFGTKKAPFSKIRLGSAKKKCPKNVSLCPIIEDDLYRSAMLNASCYLILDGAKPNCSGLFEAFASMTGVVALAPQEWNDKLINGETGMIADSVAEAAEYVNMVVSGKTGHILKNGYEVAMECSMENLSKILPSVYKELLN